MHAIIFSWYSFFLIAALVFALLATFSVNGTPRFQFFPASLACLILAFFFR